MRIKAFVAIAWCAIGTMSGMAEEAVFVKNGKAEGLCVTDPSAAWQ